MIDGMNLWEAWWSIITDLDSADTWDRLVAADTAERNNVEAHAEPVPSAWRGVLI